MKNNIAARLSKLAASILIIAICLSVLSACGKPKIVGEWTSVDTAIGMNLKFNEDGSGLMTIFGVSTETKYTTDKDSLVITYSILGFSKSEEYVFKIDGTKLSLTDSSGSVEEYVRVS